MNVTTDIVRKTIHEVKEYIDKGGQVCFLDVRNNPDESQIKGSISLRPASILEATTVTLPVPRDTLIIVY
jgi:hypothetical protein